MNGDYTKVPLRRDERWTGARMQQGRVLLDHDWNLNLDAGARNDKALARDAIGAAGVVAGSDAFRIGVTTTGALDLTVEAGRMWVDGFAALAPAPFTYSSQDQIEPLPEAGRMLVYLDVFCEHVQPAEDPLLVDPALAPIDTTARTRVGYRVRAEATDEASCETAWAALTTVAESDGTITIERAGPVAPADPCTPPGDPLAQVPDGLFRVEVLDGGSEATARFAWSFEDGGVAVPVTAIAGDTVTLAPSELRFAAGDSVEVSWLARRADRLPHGALYGIASVTPGAAGDVLELDRAVTAPATATGLAVRRWDGEAEGAASATDATWKGDDLGIRFTAAPGNYEVGDWWGARLRAEAGDGLEHRVDAAPDGVRHAFAPLALVDLGDRVVLADCRPKFTPLVDLGSGACTVSVKPGDDLQGAVERLPAGGGKICFAAGNYLIDPPLKVAGRRRVVLSGAGPATALISARPEAAVVFDGCSEVEVRHLRAQGGAGIERTGDPGLDGALTFLGCRDVVVADCVLACPDSEGREQTCVTVRGGEAGLPDRIRIERNRVEVGSGQTGVLVVDAALATVADNHVLLGPGRRAFPGVNFAVAAELRALLRAALRPRPGTGIRRVKVPGADRPLYVAGDEAAAIVSDFAAVARPSTVKRSGADKALLRFARSLSEGKRIEKLSAASRELLVRLAAQVRSAGQGIVVGGSSATTVRVTDNVVDAAIQGIHIGVSERETRRPRSIDSVVVARNVVHCVVPGNYDRERHAVFVGNTRSVHIVDTIATLRRNGGPVRVPTPVDGVRVHGVLGPFLTIRQTFLRGFSTGVSVAPISPPETRMWLVAETMAEGATVALDAPLAVDRERNVP